MSRILSAITALLLVGALAACRGNDEFSRFVEIDRAAWGYGDTVTVVVSHLDSLPSKKLSVGVVHNDDFPYQNLWVEVSYTDSIGKLYRDSVNLQLADEFGRWQGKSLAGSHQYEATLSHAFPLADSTRVNLRHIMRVDTVRGIERVGLTVSRLP
ncbi:MAG: gliding motility lipoprotein GldH [Bacteroides sp.]|nr:gliding motility lipoprotein GldH [Bacteroides sp.]MBD5320415.1 gliding motility lipoprotein GldH [Bacteroides sp.]MBD5421832.1 gliding motility lipoprotein GldH [Bacteroides sp.]MDE6039046.1 gliding motility lipoprotein GldH [Paramuribaculum sp.]MDE6051336.1 gliding motility lipoprotein GldH [Paramuribaculum sp.]